MADPTPYPDTGEDTGAGPDIGSTTSTSRWQKVVGIIGIVAILWVGNQMFDNLFPGGPGPGGPGPVEHGPGQGEPPAENQEQPYPGGPGPGGHGPGQR